MKIKKIIFLISSVAIFLLMPAFALAETSQSYFYENISQKFTVNKDTTVDVEESQTYNFTGEYHKGWRSIPLNKVSDITGVKVYDGATGRPLTRVPSSRDKTNPANWGKYYYRKNNGNLEIEWYYNAVNESRTWLLKYKLIGAISFLKDKDELYWNLFTDYDVLVSSVEASVILPGNKFNSSNLTASIYRGNTNGTGGPGTAEIIDNQTIRFKAVAVFPKEAVTIAAGWPKGLVNRGAFWWQFFLVHYALIFSILIIIATILFMILYWYFTEKRNRGRGTIIAEYSPPKALPPAMAELIVKEKLTPKAWAATVIDLAVRGYVKITEEKKSFSLKTLAPFIPAMFIILFIVFSLKDALSLGLTANSYVLFSFFTIIVIISIIQKRSKIVPKDYLIESTKPFAEDKNLRDYERKFLTAILSNGRFSTKEMKTDVSASRELYKAMKEIKEAMYEETEIETQAYEKPVSREKYMGIGFIIIFVLLFILSPLSGALADANFGFIVIIIIALVCAIAIWLQIKFEARLSAEGAILREEWLGFKLYLATAERYRLQNLTPETFEKYLPYAIIFGVEKTWGQAFKDISLPPPNWYHGAAVGSFATSGGGSSNFSSGFSASAFSASFASSFTSAFASSGGGGASGGGGGAGGGGGGGGGGAS